MATASMAGVRGRVSRVRIALRVVLFVVLISIAALAAAVGWFYKASKAALPQLDGDIRVAGLQRPVNVLRDAHGVPTIRAENLHDLLFAQGYVTAQDRLWQMDMARRYGRGQLAELLGPGFLKLDVLHRTTGTGAAADAAAASLPPQDREQLQAYADGVNASIAAQMAHLPIEFRVLRYKPQPWQVADSLVVGVNMHEMLNSSFRGEYYREKIYEKLGPQLAGDLFPNTSWHDRAPGSTAALPAGQTPDSPPEEDEDFQTNALGWLFGTDAAGCENCQPGSNNWVISGAKTRSGKPLLSNDMHLGHQIPNVWYEAHLQSGDLDVVGVTLPGMPFVIVGHNQRIAWGFTNLGPDVQDLFVENFNAKGEYETPDGWTKPWVREERIHVREFYGKDRDETVPVLVTRHGPIVSSLFPGEKRQIALQWTIYDSSTVSLPFYDVDRAHNWSEFRAAFAKFGGPSQNVVYADVDGHIGYQATGRVPIRKTGDGTVPEPGDGSRDWTGYVPFEKLPSVLDPPGGVIGTANGRITPEGYPYLLANEWGAPFRQERIYKVLEQEKKFTRDDMLALQMDTYSAFDRFCAQRLVYAVDHTQNATERAKQAADLMRRWDGRFETDSAGATLEVLSRRELWKLVESPRLGSLGDEYTWWESSISLENMLTHTSMQWLPNGYKSWNDVLAAAVESAVKSGSGNVANWTWGKRNTVQVMHPLLGNLPILSKWMGTGVQPQSGNGSYTLKAAGRGFGASERMTVDFSDLDRSTLNIVNGQSGNWTSQNFNDQWNAWYGGTTFRLPYSAASVEGGTVHRLNLLP